MLNQNSQPLCIDESSNIIGGIAGLHIGCQHLIAHIDLGNTFEGG